MRVFVLSLALALISNLDVGGQAPAVAPKAVQQRIAKLIEQLDSPSFAERELASQMLEAIGEPAFDALNKTAMKSASPEARARAKRLVSAIEKKLVVSDFERLRGGWQIVEVIDDGKKLRKELYHGRVVFSWNWDFLKEDSAIIKDLLQMDPQLQFPAEKKPAPHPFQVLWDFRWDALDVKDWHNDITNRQGRVLVGRDQAERSIDLEFRKQYDLKKQVTGVYKLDGDRLTLCLEMKGGDRPRQFETKNAPSRLMLIFEREKPAKAKR